MAFFDTFERTASLLADLETTAEVKRSVSDRSTVGGGRPWDQDECLLERRHQDGDDSSSYTARSV
jgi:hypothetical protein